MTMWCDPRQEEMELVEAGASPDSGGSGCHSPPELLMDFDTTPSPTSPVSPQRWASAWERKELSQDSTSYHSNHFTAFVPFTSRISFPVNVVIDTNPGSPNLALSPQPSQSEQISPLSHLSEDEHPSPAEMLMSLSENEAGNIPLLDRFYVPRLHTHEKLNQQPYINRCLQAVVDQHRKYKVCHLLPTGRHGVASYSQAIFPTPPLKVVKGQQKTSRPWNIYFLFQKIFRGVVKEVNPEITDNNVVCCHVSSVWKALPPEIQQIYRREVDRLTLLFREEFPQYKFCPVKAEKRKQQQTGEKPTSNLTTATAKPRYRRSKVARRKSTAHVETASEVNPTKSYVKQELSVSKDVQKKNNDILSVDTSPIQVLRKSSVSITSVTATDEPLTQFSAIAKPSIFSNIWTLSLQTSSPPIRSADEVFLKQCTSTSLPSPLSDSSSSSSQHHPSLLLSPHQSTEQLCVPKKDPLSFTSRQLHSLSTNFKQAANPKESCDVEECSPTLQLQLGNIASSQMYLDVVNCLLDKDDFSDLTKLSY